MAADEVLLTRRLRLRPLDAGDEAFVAQLICNEAVRRHLGGGVAPDDLAAAVAGYFEALEGEAVWLIEVQAIREPLGVIFLTFHKDGEDTELSYQVHPSAWGKGYATEAARSVARNVLTLERVVAETQEANMPSRRLLQRLGMTELQCVVRFGCRQLIYTT